MSIFRIFDLRKLNSITKYPSIPTYHEIGDKGKLKDTINVDFDDQGIYAYEKIDGCNARVIVPPKSGVYGTHALIGSREEFLHYTEDLIYNPMLGIVEVVKKNIELFTQSENHFRVWFFEVFGGGIGQNWKNYSSSSNNVGIRVFDIMELSHFDLINLLNQPLEKIASWREHSGQKFLNVDSLKSVVALSGLELVPAVEWKKGMSKSHSDMLVKMMRAIVETKCQLNEGCKKRPEGLVIRNFDRSKIAKVRFEDYQRTLR